MPSSEEYRKKQRGKNKGHVGIAPRIYFTQSPRDCVIKFRFKLVGGKKGGKTPMVEVGHHDNRVYFGKEATRLIVKGTQRGEDQKPLKLDQWYDVIFEIKDDEICFQIKDGFSFRGKFKETGEADRPIVAFCGTNRGTLLIDDVSVLEEVKKQVQ